MIDIDLVKLKADIVARKAMPDFGPDTAIERLRTMNATKSSFTHEVVEVLIERLQSAERERDELLQRISNAKIEREEEKRLHEEGAFMLCGQYDDLAAAMGWSSKLAERQGVSQLEYARQLNSRVIDLEARIARRDAAAGERVATHLVYSSVLPKFIGDTDEVESYSCFISGKTPPRKTMGEAYADAHRVCGPLYTAAQPAVLPPEVNEREAFNTWNNDENLPIAGVPAKNAAWLAWQARAALGAQPAASVSDALREAVNAIYFTDSSDYFSALWSIVRFLSPETADLLAKDERAAFERVNANLQHAAAPEPGGVDG